MNIKTFELERIQSLFENTVEYNLTESGFHPYTINELLNEAQIHQITNTVLGYGQTNGSIALREAISLLYQHCTQDNVLVTNGSSEANFVACNTLLQKGDEVIIMVPNYMQIAGIAESLGCAVKTFQLREDQQWSPDLDELRAKVSDKTKMIAVCNPNNPTGYTLTKQEMLEIVEIASLHGSWIYSDEVYRGAELNGTESDSFFGMYDRVMTSGGLSKAYALPGIRLGWLTGPEKIIANAWAYHDYTSITAGILSHKIGEIALSPDVRPGILARNRTMLSENLQATLSWVNNHRTTFRFVPPKAGGMAFMHYDIDINSTELSEWLRIEKSVFIIAGDCYGMDHYIRIGIGSEKDYLINGLERINEALKARFGS